MSGPLVAVVLTVMLVGVVGTVLPLLPGLALIWSASVVGSLVHGFDGRAWLLNGVLTVLLLAGASAKYVLPARSTDRSPTSSLVAAVLGGMVGLVTVPVVGFPLGAALGLFLAEVRRTGSGQRARTSTLAALRAFGIGALVEIAVGAVMIATWWTLRPR